MNDTLESWVKMGSYFKFNDNNIFLIDKGKGDCLLIFHGYPYNSYDFKDLLPKLCKHFRVLIPDMLGMGFSDKPSRYHYSFEDHVEMYRCLLQHLKIAEVHVMAHDLGNSVVQEFLAQYEENQELYRIKSIAFLNGGLFTDVYQPRLLQILLSQSPPFIGKVLSRLISKRSIEKATRSVFGKNTQPSEQLLDDFWKILNYNKGKLLTWKIGRLVFDKKRYQHRWIKAMQKTKIPMCFINGPADPNSGIHMVKRYIQLIPNADVRLMADDIGHWPQIEAPDEVYKYYWYFINADNINSVFEK